MSARVRGCNLCAIQCRLAQNPLTFPVPAQALLGVQLSPLPFSLG